MDDIMKSLENYLVHLRCPYNLITQLFSNAILTKKDNNTNDIQKQAVG